MIGKLKGVVDEFGDDHVILDVGGVGYVAHCSSRTLQSMPRLGEPAALFIDFQMREDLVRLYGFRTEGERDWFRLLQTVQGVGSKVALAILSIMDAGGLATAIAMNDRASIGRAPGVGPKLAARICAELKDKAPAFGHIGDPAAAALAGALDERRAPGPVSDAVSALMNLGYGGPQATAAIAQAAQALGEEAQVPQLIRQGLKELAR